MTCNNEKNPILITKKTSRTSLVAQWVRIRLPIQGTRVGFLVGEDSMYHRATKPVVTAAEPAPKSAPRRGEPPQWPVQRGQRAARSSQLEKVPAQQQRLVQAKLNKNTKNTNMNADSF